MQSAESNILVVGMGVTGLSVSAYLNAAGVAYNACDDAGSNTYGSCREALLSGPDFILKSPGIPEKLIDNSRDKAEVLNDIELFLRLNKKPTIFVTGTNGKSTVVGLLECVLKASGIKAIACGNNGIPIFDAYNECADLYILELSSYQLENLSTLTSFSSVVLNIGIDHLDRYEGLGEYQKIKERVYAGTGSPIYPVLSNGEYSFVGDIAGYQPDATNVQARYWLDGETIYLNDAPYCSVKDIALEGIHNYLNVCAVLALCHGMSLSKPDILLALSSFYGLAHRLELVCIDSLGRRWVNDSKSTNVHAAKAALESIDGSLCLIMGGQSKNESYVGLFNQYKEKIDQLIIYGKDAEIISRQAGARCKEVVSDVASAVNLADKLTGRSGLVLFSPACASFDQYKDFNERGKDFRANVLRTVSCKITR